MRENGFMPANPTASSKVVMAENRKLMGHIKNLQDHIERLELKIGVLEYEAKQGGGDEGPLEGKRNEEQQEGHEPLPEDEEDRGEEPEEDESA
jgi:hypothetical protein